MCSSQLIPDSHSCLVNVHAQNVTEIWSGKVFFRQGKYNRRFEIAGKNAHFDVILGFMLYSAAKYQPKL